MAKILRAAYGSKNNVQKLYEALGLAMPDDNGLVGVEIKVVAGQPITIIEIRNVVTEEDAPEAPQPLPPSEAEQQPQPDAPVTDAPETSPVADAPQG